MIKATLTIQADSDPEMTQLTLGVHRQRHAACDLNEEMVGLIFAELIGSELQGQIFPDHDLLPSFLDQFERLIDRWGLTVSHATIWGPGINISAGLFLQKLAARLHEAAGSDEAKGTEDTRPE